MGEYSPSRSGSPLATVAPSPLMTCTRSREGAACTSTREKPPAVSARAKSSPFTPPSRERKSQVQFTEGPYPWGGPLHRVRLLRLGESPEVEIDDLRVGHQRLAGVRIGVGPLGEAVGAGADLQAAPRVVLDHDDLDTGGVDPQAADED